MAPQDENDFQNFPSESETFLELGFKMWFPESFENRAVGVARFEDLDPQGHLNAIGGNDAALATYIEGPALESAGPESTQYDSWEDFHGFGAEYDLRTDPDFSAFCNVTDAILAEQSASLLLSSPDVEAPPMFSGMPLVDIAHDDSATPYIPDEETIALLNEIDPYCYTLPPELVPNPAAPYDEVTPYQSTELSSSTASIYPASYAADGGMGVSEYASHSDVSSIPHSIPVPDSSRDSLPPLSRQVIFSTHHSGRSPVGSCAASGSITLEQVEQRMADARSTIHALAPVQCMWDPALCSEFVTPEDMYIHLGTAHQVATSGLTKVVCKWSSSSGGACGDTVQASSLRKHITSKKHLNPTVKCYSCGHVYARLEALKDHLVGRVQPKRQRTTGGAGKK
ncbi:hypothetical protein R3P38DRAFT_3360649 [Favolaschia claudopus]|uniref:C2H2-type domain-containing protein n=1 Tax=Favolaschia claudopus TaxID=2862362 RepID=A0AAW0AV76_9AGAR